LQPSAFAADYKTKDAASKQTVDGCINSAKTWIDKVKPYAERGEAPPIGHYGLVDLSSKGRTAVQQTCVVECV
jgi:hypothetical protein